MKVKTTNRKQWGNSHELPKAYNDVAKSQENGVHNCSRLWPCSRTEGVPTYDRHKECQIKELQKKCDTKKNDNFTKIHLPSLHQQNKNKQ